MTSFIERIGQLSPKRLALLALEQHEQIEAAGRRAHAPIAVVGMACRFPGGCDDLQAFWTLLSEGRDAIGEVPADRWDIDAFFDPDPDAPARMSARSGGFLSRIGEFDPAFFGIAPREALTMDPQQRLLLEVAWHALEHAGIAADRLAGSPTGVFVGICNSDHFQRLLHRGAEAIDAYLASGNAHSVAAGRIAYCLGLQGPALAIDTACSSSLVALHAACASLRSGESRLALAGGVNVMCSPETTIALSKAHMLAPDGRCKAFDAAADGFSRGEGCGVLVLKRLDEALADGDRVLAVIRGTAANQDGRSGGLTVPNGPAQEAVIRSALADAGVQPRDIDYVEAHGTGTSLGDPIEVRALAGALGDGRTHAEPLLVGSVKTNLGHLESAAGIAGVIKVILALGHERIPPHLHFRAPNPHIAWADYPVRVTAQGQAWPRGERRRLAGVSSFGFSGTNAHVVIEEAPATAVRAPASLAHRPVHCLPLSARTPAALKRLAAAYAERLGARDADPAERFGDVAQHAGTGRVHFGERLAVVAASAAEAGEALRAWAAGEAHPAVHRGSVAPGPAPEVVFLFTGQGSQYPGMARELYDHAPVFRDVIDRCDTLLGPDAHGRRLRDVLWTPGGDDAPVHQTAWTQPALFAVEYGLAQLWRSWGVEPAAVIGHSVGEYVAACVAGVFSLEDGLALIAERGRLMQGLPPGGAMAAVFAPAEEVAAAVARRADRLAVAAINASDSVVVSGEAGAVDELLAELQRREWRGHRLFVSLAAHSPLVEPALDEMEACARRVTMRPPRLPVAWNVTGGVALPGGAPDAAYWRRHLREPVRFADGMLSLYEQGWRTFLEVGPHPTLVALAQRSLPEEDTVWLGSLRRGRADLPEMTSSLAALYARGARIDWRAVADRPAGPVAPLPAYPFERETYWLSPAAAQGRAAWRTSTSRGNDLRCEALPTAVPLFERMLTPDAPAYLSEHRVLDAPVAAGPVFLELAAGAAAQAFGRPARQVEDFAISEPLVLPDSGRTVQVHLVPDPGAPGGRAAFSIHSRAADGSGAWTRHAGGHLVIGGEPAPALPAADTLGSLRARLGPSRPGDDFYARLSALGIALGPSFRSLREAHHGDGEVLARIELPAACRGGDVALAHPALLDGALQAAGLALPATADTDSLYLLAGISRLRLDRALPPELWCHVRLHPPGPGAAAEWRADIALRDATGEPLGELAGVCLRRATRDALRHAVRDAAGARPEAPRADAGLHYALAWEPAPAAPAAAAGLRGPRSIAGALQACFASLALRHDLALYDALLPELDRLSAMHVRVALRALGFDDTVGRSLDSDAEAKRLGILARHRRLFARMLDMLAEDGDLRAGSARGAYVVARTLGRDDPAGLQAQLLRRFGPVDGELLTLQRCAGELAAVLTGKADAVALLFPGGSLAQARQLYVESPCARTYNGALAQALRDMIAGLPAQARLRILEVGAGTGGTTECLLPLLPPERTDYTFTDVSPHFLERAAEQFAAWPSMRRALLDIERDPATQGFVPGQYDVVIAANVLHATADLARSLRHVHRLLAPGGALLLLEGMAPERWVDLSFGLTEGWWRFSDTALRPSYPLVSRDAWRDVLSAEGFVEATFVPGHGGGRVRDQQALVLARKPLRQRTFVLVDGEGGPWADALAARLQARGDAVQRCAAEAVPASLPADADVVYLAALPLAQRPGDEPSTAAACEALACRQPLAWMNRLAVPGTSARLWLVTRGAQRTRAGDAVSRWQAPLWGLGRVFALEHPARWGGLVDLPLDGGLDELVPSLLASLDAPDTEDQTAWRGGQRWAARLVPAPDPGEAPIRLRGDATYLVTGGFGGLGLLVARWMAERGARHIALLGRRPDADLPGVRAIESLGASVIALTADVADAAALQAAFERLKREAPPLRGVVHAAAAFSTAPVGELDADRLHDMLLPKVAGTLQLERMTRDLPLEFTVLFSSTTALLGASGLAHYAAANAFLDATAHALDRPDRRVLSIGWGTWESMRLASEADRAFYRASGLQPMAAATALEAMGRLLATDRAMSIVAQVDWDALKAVHEARRVRPMLSKLPARPEAPAALAPRQEGGSSPPTLGAEFAGLPAEMRQDRVVAFVLSEVESVLGRPRGSGVPLNAGLFDLGMDSLMSVELKRRLERGVGRALPSTLTFNYPNVGALAGFIERELTGAAASQTPPAAAPVDAPVDVHPDTLADVHLDALSEAELEQRLLARLKQMS